MISGALILQKYLWRHKYQGLWDIYSSLICLYDFCPDSFLFGFTHAEGANRNIIRYVFIRNRVDRSNTAKPEFSSEKRKRRWRIKQCLAVHFRSLHSSVYTELDTQSSPLIIQALRCIVAPNNYNSRWRTSSLACFNSTASGDFL